MNRAAIESLPYARDSSGAATRLSDAPSFMYLDSCAASGGGGRYDILVAEPRMRLVTVGGLTTIEDRGGVTRSRRDPFQLVAEALGELGPAACDLPFAGGAVGYFGYDLARRIERLPSIARRDIDMPDMTIGIYEHALVVDHVDRAAYLVSHPRARSDPGRLRAAWTAQTAVTPAAFATSFEVTAAVRPEIDYAQYVAALRRIKRYIEDGDVYQVNYAQRFSAPIRGAPWDAYLRLRHLNPAPFSAFIAAPGGAILSSSPERFIRIHGEEVETRPIKGTRPRSTNRAEDTRLAAELAASEKDQAENVMIVDLLRNDLGKTCRAGSVRVPTLFAVESYAKVHHLVSTVYGSIASGYSMLDVLRACFPGGSITGAPKIRAMEIVEELEPCRRGVYCGAIGYMGANGCMDTNIAIRTLVAHRDRLYCWAGGGIVMDSLIEAEYQESLTKAAAMLEVFANAEVQGIDH